MSIAKVYFVAPLNPFLYRQSLNPFVNSCVFHKIDMEINIRELPFSS